MSRLPDPFASRQDRQIFRRRLLRWFASEGRDLPWRRTRDPYAILVSEMMLQQTQVATVLPYFERWLKRFPNIATLARAGETDVLNAWQGLGYYSRARNLHAAAKQVVRNFAGELPSEREMLASLPGVGRYTAGAIATFAFDRTQPIVEANIARVLSRLTNSEIPIDTVAGRDFLWHTARELLPSKNVRLHNSALMDLGAIVCRPRRPLCSSCPVRSFCRAENPTLLPRKKERSRTIRLVEFHAFIRERNLVLLEHSRERWRGMWILPRLSRLPKRSPLLRLDFPFTHHRITLAVFALPRSALPNDRHQWFPLRALSRLPLPTPHRRALSELLSMEMPDLPAVS
ncbi:MAG TPA: A/G-specific adenine glycosylase [Chthoniobacterales bacterium]